MTEDIRRIEIRSQHAASQQPLVNIMTSNCVLHILNADWSKNSNDVPRVIVVLREVKPATVE